MDIVKQPVTQRVGMVGVTDRGMPLGSGCWVAMRVAAFGPLLDDLHEVASFSIFERRQQPIIRWREPRAPTPIAHAELTVANALGRTLEVLQPQQVQRHAGALEFTMRAGQIGLRAHRLIAGPGKDFAL